MKQSGDIQLITTIREHCRMCYTCVRECPAKAIRITEGQAEVVSERCVGCGNCVRVCSQRAKRMYDSTRAVEKLLASGRPTAALVAPSFPAEFTECTSAEFVGMVRALGFPIVGEVSFGADLVARAYRELLENNGNKRYVATTCPAIVAFVERYHPDITPMLAPIISPMAAAARAFQRLHGEDMDIVFIGPCIAKKGELVSEHLQGEVVEGLTFIELRQMLTARGITPDSVEDSDFDPPHGGPGGLFPISRGLLQAANISDDLVESRVIAADGRSAFVDAIDEFEAGHLDVQLLEVLACNGCINGPGIANRESLFGRRSKIGSYVRERLAKFDWDAWNRWMEQCSDLALARGYTADDQRIPAPSEEELGKILRRLGKARPEDELNCGACGYDTCREHAVAIFKGLAENEMCLPQTISQLRRTMHDLAVSNDKLEETREALVHTECLASMGQLAAGIAHELNNPLGVVLMYAHLLREEHGEEGAAAKLHEDLDMIVEQADRCKKIVAGLLHFARQNKVDRSPVVVGNLIDRAVKASPAPKGIELDVRNEAGDEPILLDRDQMLQVLTNLMGNAYGAMSTGGKLSIHASRTENQVKIKVSDTGVGISKEVRDKIFEPFFTTKEVGKGTGLGLAVTYGIIKMHSGGISVESNDDPDEGPTGSTFTVSLPAGQTESNEAVVA
jgi:signal transduction histidine kinase/iron only hydrogenase large subunit-like protein